MSDDQSQPATHTKGRAAEPAQAGARREPSRKRAATVIRSCEAEIMTRWERQVRAEVEAAREQEKLLLRNQLAPYLETIIDLLESSSTTTVRDECERPEFDPSANRSHGRLRATLPGYSLDQVMAEYTILRRTITDLVDEHGLLDERVHEVITAVNEQALMHAVLAFNATLHRVRKKSVSMLMHDMRQPLNAIDLLAGVLERSDDAKLQVAGRIREQVDRMDTMLSEMLDAVRLQAGQALELKIERLDLLAELEQWVKGARLAHSDRLDVRTPGSSLEMDLDSAALSRAVENLMANAFKYGDPNEKVTITVEATDQQVWISVHNWGRPIDETEQARIFVAFEQANHTDDHFVEEGWGLGLTYVRAVVDGLGGTIKLHSSEKAGTAFTLELPRWQS